MTQKIFVRNLKRILNKTVPLWVILVLIFYSSAGVGLIEYYIMKRNINTLSLELAKRTRSPEELVQILKQEVLPQKGYMLGAVWGDVGKKLIESGAIDKKKYEDLFSSEPQTKDYMKYLKNSSKDHMVINEKNSHFMVNTLWALGLVNKSKILDEGSMKKYANGNVMNFASTGGWSLGSKPTDKLYSSSKLIKLTPEQEEIVKKIASNIYRPCCNNNTEFPDCNHGMAALGYIQLAVSQGLSERKIYKDILSLNSFWFPQNYVDIAAFFDKKGTSLGSVDPKTILSFEYSSAQGAQKIKQSIQSMPGFSTQGAGGCGT
ncbi:MAG: hypothetical protein A2958_02380 [Candidatus Levybacteria bacterium RIFCSPLOWO2_01_FULL_38_13]|nr:MAG: hypothetical protein A2629_04010 [Candidatus Levybacteria bacterium RIFCSPHIGHO2_01_FULL_41_15]OGH35096.1 MAG: hypothetical protein A2958_02380 [Candidatus Levybacteria bacterium RIFCSPLOWO2_01_FULL_38_13]